MKIARNEFTKQQTVQYETTECIVISQSKRKMKNFDQKEVGAKATHRQEKGQAGV